jgi:hypothetical protein
MCGLRRTGCALHGRDAVRAHARPHQRGRPTERRLARHAQHRRAQRPRLRAQARESALSFSCPGTARGCITLVEQVVDLPDSRWMTTPGDVTSQAKSLCSAAHC